MTRPIIKLFSPGFTLDTRLIQAMQSIVPFQFVACHSLDECQPGDSLVNFSGDPAVARRVRDLPVNSFSFVLGNRSGTSSDQPLNRVAFGTTPLLHRAWRGRSLLHRSVSADYALRPGSADEILATYADQPVWIACQVKPWTAHVVSLRPAPLSAGSLPYGYFYEKCFLYLLPLIQFLKNVTADSGWKEPPLRACFIFDDPNLRSTSYGFIRFRELLKLAAEERFHVAFATVPVDLYTANRSAVAMFRDNPKHLSLLMHGNDHIRGEMALPESTGEHLMRLAQSLRRVARFEARTGLKIARVMVPPHEEHCEAAIEAMLSLGFVGACISHGSVIRCKTHNNCGTSFGFAPANVMHNGFPVLHRYNVSPETEAGIVISAFLNQPIIPIGHHDTLAEGHNVLARLAQIVASVGDVSWMGPEEIFASNYATLKAGQTLCVKPYSANFEISIPEGISEVVLQAPEHSAFRTVRHGKNGSTSVTIKGTSPVLASAGETLAFTHARLAELDYRTTKSPRTSFWPLTRRVLCEVRDRIAPLKRTLRLSPRQSPTA